jgi:hypothetical protein
VTRSARFGLLTALFAAALFFVFHSPSTLAPSSIAWLLDHDAAAHFVGWQFYRHTALGWPIGWIGSYLHPLGTSIGQTDSIPLLAIPFRFLSPLLPGEAQYFGWWLLFCWIAQAVVAQRLLRANDPTSIIGALLFVISPALLFRALMRHEALAFHASVLAGFALYRADWSSWRPAWQTALLLALLGLVHPYLVAMVAGLALAAAIRAGVDTGRPALLRAGAGLGLGLLLAAIGVYAVGYLEGGSSQRASGFGECAADLLTFANPGSVSTFLRGFQVLPCRQEGYAYLGLGGIGLVLVALLLAGRRDRGGRFRGIGGVTAWPLWAITGAMGIYALSSDVTLFHVDVLDLSRLYALLEPIPSILQSSGRFIWPLYYLVLWWAVERVVEGAGTKRALAILCGCFALQAIDVWPKLIERFSAWKSISAPDVAPPDMVEPSAYVHLAVHPASLISVFRNDRYVTLARFAALHGLTINSGYTSRIDRAAAEAYVERFSSELARGEIAADTVYAFLDAPPEAALAALRCGRLLDVTMCVAKDNKDPFAKSLDPAR